MGVALSQGCMHALFIKNRGQCIYNTWIFMYAPGNSQWPMRHVTSLVTSKMKKPLLSCHGIHNADAHCHKRFYVESKSKIRTLHPISVMHVCNEKLQDYLLPMSSGVDDAKALILQKNQCRH